MFVRGNRWAVVADAHQFVYFQGLRQGMGDEEHGDLAPQLVDGGGKMLGGGRIQTTGRLVEDQYPGLLEERPGNGLFAGAPG